MKNLTCFLILLALALVSCESEEPTPLIDSSNAKTTSKQISTADGPR
ncbi:MAG: hypothetical protein JXR10_02900 [Cyclobacteriaceae bacterium]